MNVKESYPIADRIASRPYASAAAAACWRQFPAANEPARASNAHVRKQCRTRVPLDKVRSSSEFGRPSNDKMSGQI